MTVENIQFYHEYSDSARTRAETEMERNQVSENGEDSLIAMEPDADTELVRQPVEDGKRTSSTLIKTSDEL